MSSLFTLDNIYHFVLQFLIVFFFLAWRSERRHVREYEEQIRWQRQQQYQKDATR